MSVLRTEAVQSEVNKRMVDKKTESYTFKFYVRVYHVYQKYGRHRLKNVLCVEESHKMLKIKTPLQ